MIYLIIGLVIGLFLGLLISVFDNNSKEQEESNNLKNLLINDFGCIYCKHYYCDSNGASSCTLDKKSKYIYYCYEPDFKKIGDKLK